jgi:hypothetical protein
VARLIIPRLDLQVRGIDAAVVRAALDRLPALLTTALKHPASPTTGYEPATVRVNSRVDAETLASTLAARIAAVVRQRTSTPSHLPVTSAWHMKVADHAAARSCWGPSAKTSLTGPPASMRAGVGDITDTSESVE